MTIQETHQQVGPTEAELEQQRQARLDALAEGAADDRFGEDEELEADPADLLTPAELSATSLDQDPGDEAPPEEEPAEAPAGVEEPGPKPDPLEAVHQLADRLAEKLQPRSEPDKPAPSKREELRAVVEARTRPEALAAALAAEGLKDTPQNRKDLANVIMSDAQRIDAMLVAEEAVARANATQEEFRQYKVTKEIEPELEKAGVTTLPAKARTLVQHYTREYVALGKSPAEAVEFALAETGFGEILAAKPKTPTKPAAAVQHRGSSRAIAAQAVAGRAQPTATAPRRKPAATEEERQANILRLARSGF